MIEQTMLLKLDNLSASAFLGLAVFLSSPYNRVDAPEDKRFWVPRTGEGQLADAVNFARLVRAQEKPACGAIDVTIEVMRCLHLEGDPRPYYVPQKYIVELLKSMDLFI